MKKHTFRNYIGAAKHITLILVFSFVMLFAFSAGASEYAAADSEAEFYIECGEGHESSAQTIESHFNHPGFSYRNVSATRTGTKIKVTCPADLTIKQMKEEIRLCLFTGTTTIIMENNELLWRSMIALDPIDELETWSQISYQVSEFDSYRIDQMFFEKTLYLLWEKPFDKTAAVTIATPNCGSTDQPEVTCDTLSFAQTNIPGLPYILPEWFSSKPDVQHPNWKEWDKTSYTGTLEGGTPYFACAAFDAPWGYYFPENFSAVTVNGQPANVWDASLGDEYQMLYVGAYVTPTHVWDDSWTLTKKPTCSTPGTETRNCTAGCGASDTRSTGTDPNAHSWGAWKVSKNPTALNTGLEKRVCGYNSTHVQTRTVPATGVSGMLLEQMKASGTTKLNLSWTKVKGAAGYDIFFAKCNSKESTTKLKLIKTIKGNSTFAWTKSGLKKNTAYKTQIKAFAYKSGKKTYVRTSPVVHAFTSGGSSKYTNPKSVSVNKTTVSIKKGGTFQIKGKVIKLNAKKTLIPKAHGAALRYYSSNKSVATVSASGKITAKASGKCTVYVLAINGVRKAIAVTVK